MLKSILDNVVRVGKILDFQYCALIRLGRHTIEYNFASELSTHRSTKNLSKVIR